MKMTCRIGMLWIVLGLVGCSAMRATTFVHPTYNFAFVERVAVVPFENLTDDRGAAARSTRYFVTELLATDAFDVIEPGEVTEAMGIVGSIRVAEMTQEQIVAVGRAVGAQGLFLGSVTEAASVRSGSHTSNVVTLDVRLVETETGSVVWSTTLTHRGRTFFDSLFGTSGLTMSETSRMAARRAIGKLVE